MNFLKKIGMGIIKYLPVALGVGQLVAASDPKAQPVIDKLGQIQSLAMTLEKAFESAGIAKGGAQKIAALQQFTLEILQQSELVISHGVADPTLLSKAANEIAQGVVDALQSLKGADGSLVAGTSTLPTKTAV